MIRFATFHDLGKNRSLSLGRGRVRGRGDRYILKYFDPWMPLAEHQAEYVPWQRKPQQWELPDTCLIEQTDMELFHEVPRRASSDMKHSVTSFMFDDRPLPIWNDMCRDADYYDQPEIVFQKLLLFLFWHQKGILWDRRLFLQCNPPFTPRVSFQDET